MDEQPNVLVMFMEPSPDDIVSRLCWWWISRQSEEDKEFGCSHVCLAIGDWVYEWRVGGLEFTRFKEWAQRDRNAVRIRHIVSLNQWRYTWDVYLSGQHLKTLSMVHGPTYADFLKYSLGQDVPMLCTGFVRRVLQQHVVNSTPLHLYNELRLLEEQCTKNNAHNALAKEETPAETT